MESVIIEEMRAFLRLDLNPRQHKYFTDTINVAKRVKVVPVSEVFNEREIELIRRLSARKNKRVTKMRIC